MRLFTKILPMSVQNGNEKKITLSSKSLSLFSKTTFAILFMIFFHFTFGYCEDSSPAAAPSSQTHSRENENPASHPTPSFYEEMNGSKTNEPDRFFSEFINMLTTLGLIVVLIFAVSWLLKRLLNTRIQQMNTKSVIKIVERRSLSPKSSLYLLEVHGKNFMIGESSNGLINLGDIPFEEGNQSETLIDQQSAT
jgi:flagellar biogenesis protein FliO